MEIQLYVSEEELAIFPEETPCTGCPKPTLQQNAGDSKATTSPTLHPEYNTTPNSPTLPHKGDKPALYKSKRITKHLKQCNIVQKRLKREKRNNKPERKDTVGEQPKNSTLRSDHHFRPASDRICNFRPAPRPDSGRHFRPVPRLHRHHFRPEANDRNRIPSLLHLSVTPPDAPRLLPKVPEKELA